MKKIYLIGHPLAHSYSPLIHSYLADYDYSLADIEPCDLKRFTTEENWDGMNVTIPYKREIISFLDFLSPEAERIGSVNTVVRKNGKLIGYNTDYYGFKYLIDKAGFDFAGQKVLILGSGGSSLTVQTVAKDALAAETVVISRSGENNYSNIQKHYDSDYIVNTTPVGMYPECRSALVDIKAFRNLKGVVDLIYNPSKTNLILDAEENRIRAVSGLGMLAAQAAKSAELFIGKAVADPEIDSIIKKVSVLRKNIALIGMPGCGKSTVGRILAEKTGRRFCDTDTVITEITSQSPEQIIEESGEERFRMIETGVLADLAKQSSLVISTGGGVVTRNENIRLLHQNSTVVFLKRPLDCLESSGRPLSLREGVEHLWSERKDGYEFSADITVGTSPSPEETAEKILRGIYS